MAQTNPGGCMHIHQTKQSWVFLENMYHDIITISSGQYDIVSRYFYPFSFFYISHETYEYYIEKPPQLSSWSKNHYH